MSSAWRRARRSLSRRRRMGRSGLVAVLTGLCVLWAAGTAASASSLRFSQVTVTVSPANRTAPFDVRRRLRVPRSWVARVWARVPDARYAVWTPQGHLLVASSAAGRVIELIPAAHGPSVRKKVILSGLTVPQGLAFDTVNGVRVLYVAESDRIDRYVWLKSGRPGTRTVVITGLPDTSPIAGDVHRPKSIAIGRDHTIYVAVGSASNATPPLATDSPPRAAILAYRPDGGGMRVFATGVRNGEGLSIAPDGSLWTAVNERDQVAYPFHAAYGGFLDAFGHVIPAYVNEHPPDEIARLTAGRNLGWPFCNPDPDTQPGRASTALQYAAMPFDNDVQTNAGGTALDCASLAPIERGLPAHSAPLGFTFLDRTAMRSRWAHGAVVAVHGSWNRDPPRPPAVLWLGWQSAKRTLGPPVTLVSGFQEPSRERWGRPTDAVAGPDGALYVTDDTAGAVYRIGPPER